MFDSQWLHDVQLIIGSDPPKLFCCLANKATENNTEGIFARKCQNSILSCLQSAKSFLGEIRRDAQDFTLHDITHCINVISLMGQLLADTNFINSAEISIIIYAALLHDIGMVNLPSENIDLIEVRENHGDRSAQFIRNRELLNENGRLLDFGELDDVYVEFLPLICASHMQDFSFVEKLPQNYLIDGMSVDMSLCAILLRLADAMDLTRNRAPYQLYRFLVNKSVSPSHWKKHMSITCCQINDNGVYRVDGICHDELAHRCLFNHLDMIESEIEKVFKWCKGPHPRLTLKTHIVLRNINPTGYQMWNHTLTMDVPKISSLFMGEQLYGDRKAGLREIIQNSLDACLVRDELNKRAGVKRDYSYRPEIVIIFDHENRQVIIRDNGTGMDNYIIQNYFLNIGASYYSSRNFEKLNLQYSPSGFFGIGFLACFMLSDDVYVRTSHWQENVEYELHLVKNDKFVTKREYSKSHSGTEIRLDLDTFSDVFCLDDNYCKNMPIVDSTINFLKKTFWNIDANSFEDGIITCVVRAESFLEFALQRQHYHYGKGHCIDISQYLLGVEGIINLSNSNLYSKLMHLAGVTSEDSLEAIKTGHLGIGDDVRVIFPFVNKFYTYSHDVFQEIDDNTLQNNYDVFLFFPSKNLKLNLGYEMRKELEMEDREIEEFFSRFSKFSWNCLCISNADDDIYSAYLPNYERNAKIDFNFLSTHNRSFHFKDEYSFMELFIDLIGYTPECFIEVLGCTKEKFSNMIYLDNVTFVSWGDDDLGSKWWLKQASIYLSEFAAQTLHFIYLTITNINIRITSSLIIPNSSRTQIIDSSGNILRRAIIKSVFLWIYENIKTSDKATASSSYLKELVLDNWDDFNGLLRPEKKPT